MTDYLAEARYRDYRFVREIFYFAFTPNPFSHLFPIEEGEISICFQFGKKLLLAIQDTGLERQGWQCRTQGWGGVGEGGQCSVQCGNSVHHSGGEADQFKINDWQ
jgi:hypothetical protein